MNELNCDEFLYRRPHVIGPKITVKLMYEPATKLDTLFSRRVPDATSERLKDALS